MNIQRPSFLRFFSIYHFPGFYPSFTFSIAFLILFIQSLLENRDVLSLIVYLAIAIPCALVAFPPFFKKYGLVSSIFKSGSQIEGHIIDTHFFHGSGYITYEYSYQMRKYRASDNVHKTRVTRNFLVGQAVRVFIDSKKPQHAFLREIYL